METRALGTWDEMRRQKGMEEREPGQGPQKTPEHSAPPPPPPPLLPGARIFLGCCSVAALSNEALAALFWEDQSSSRSLPRLPPTTWAGRELVGPG